MSFLPHRPTLATAEHDADAPDIAWFVHSVVFPRLRCLNAIQALSQLSYSPMSSGQCNSSTNVDDRRQRGALGSPLSCVPPDRSRARHPGSAYEETEPEADAIAEALDTSTNRTGKDTRPAFCKSI